MSPLIQTIIFCLITLCSFVEPSDPDGASQNTDDFYRNIEISKECLSNIVGYLFLNDAFYNRYTKIVGSDWTFATMLSEFSPSSPFKESDITEVAHPFVDKRKIDQQAREKLLSSKLDWNSISSVSRNRIQYSLVEKKMKVKGEKTVKMMDFLVRLFNRTRAPKIDTINYLEYQIAGEDALKTPKSLSDLTYRDMVNWVAHYFECLSAERQDRKEILEACRLAFYMLTEFVKKQIDTVNKSRLNSYVPPSAPIVAQLTVNENVRFTFKDFSWKTISTFHQKWNHLPTAYQNGIILGSRVIFSGLIPYFAVPWLVSAILSKGNSTNALDSLKHPNDSLPGNDTKFGPPKTPLPDLYIIFAIIGLLVLVAIIICFCNCYSQSESNYSTEKSKTCKTKSKKSKQSKKSKKSKKSFRKRSSKSGKRSKVKTTKPSSDNQIKTRKSSGIEKNQSKKQVVKSKSIKRIELKPQAVVRPLSRNPSSATSSVRMSHSSKRHLHKSSSSFVHSTKSKSTFEKPNQAPKVAKILPTLVKPSSNALVKPTSSFSPSGISTPSQDQASHVPFSIAVTASSAADRSSKILPINQPITKKANISALSQIKTGSASSIPFKTALSYHPLK